jgi:hypothetical protein
MTPWTCRRLYVAARRVFHEGKTDFCRLSSVRNRQESRRCSRTS